MREVEALFQSVVKSIGGKYPEDAIATCCTYINHLVKWNIKTNLVGKTTPYDIAYDLCVDSIHLAFVLQQYQNIINIVDCGAGAGIPGIPLRCFYRDGHYLMIECREKRGLFIESALRLLKLPNTLCRIGRVERICPELHIDAVLSRAFMPPHELLPYVSQFLNSEKYLIVMFSTDTFLTEGYRVIERYVYNIGKGTRYIIILQKI